MKRGSLSDLGYGFTEAATGLRFFRNERELTNDHPYLGLCWFCVRGSEVKRALNHTRDENNRNRHGWPNGSRSQAFGHRGSFCTERVAVHLVELTGSSRRVPANFGMTAPCPP